MPRKEGKKIKSWEDLDITDDFIFTRVMRNKRLCRTLLEMILKVKVGRIKFLTSHHAIRVEPNAKGIIMDVYLKDEDKVINVEMQTSDHGDLPRRSRYYQAAADIDTTPKGSDYEDLKENFVIFICTFDPFGRGRPVYKFQNVCFEYDDPIFLNDGTTKLFLNTAAESLDGLDRELQLFYDYVRGESAQTTFTKELDKTISRLKEDKEGRQMSLLYASRMMECRRDGYEEGISIGLEQGAYQSKLETARNMLEDGFPVSTVSKYTGLPPETVQQLVV